MHLGLVTYQLAKDWDLETIIANCRETGFEGVELRTTHAHGVEVSLSKPQRDEVKGLFADSPVKLVGLGSAFQYHYSDPIQLKAHIDGTKEYTLLARDVGAPGVKVRPNSLLPDIPEEKTLEQIGLALRECAEFAADCGIEIRLEVHGRHTQHLPRIQTILAHAGHENAKVCWNCNMTDLEDRGFDSNFNLVSDDISLVHLHDLSDEQYPYAQLLRKLDERGYDGFCLAEISESRDPICVMNYYRALFHALLPN